MNGMSAVEVYTAGKKSNEPANFWNDSNFPETGVVNRTIEPGFELIGVVLYSNHQG
jgi:hypothetical protein